MSQQAQRSEQQDSGLLNVGGKLVRDIWIKWAKEQPNPKPSWLVPWEKLSEPEKEVDRRIFAACAERPIQFRIGFATHSEQQECIKRARQIEIGLCGCLNDHTVNGVHCPEHTCRYHINIADALAVAQERVSRAWIKAESDTIQQLRAALAAEREKYKQLEIHSDFGDEEMRQMREELAAERQRCEQAEKWLEEKQNESAMFQADSSKYYNQLLSAQAVIEKWNNFVNTAPMAPMANVIKFDISALHEHDAEVRLPLSIALKQIADGLKGSSGSCRDCDSAMAVAENALLWTSGSDAIENHDADVREPLVDILQAIYSQLRGRNRLDPLLPFIEKELAKVKEAI